MRECALCGVDFENGNVAKPRPHSRHRCHGCKRFVCLDCHVFDDKGRTECWRCRKQRLRIDAAVKETCRPSERK